MSCATFVPVTNDRFMYFWHTP